MKPRGNKRVPSQKENIFQEIDSTPIKFQGRLWPTNLQEEKEKFLRFGVTPHFQLKESALDLDKAINKKRGQIQFGLLEEAKTILDCVKNKFGDGDNYFDTAFGKVINQQQATDILIDYLNDNGIKGEITIYWTPELTAFAKMMWHGPNLRANRPEARKYTLIIKNCVENQMLRERGIFCLANHEIGTHFFRMVNDGLQPWFSDREKFGLRAMKTREYLASEEGLATLNTIISANSKYLFRAALQYYTACMCASMSFKEVYEHLATYVKNEDARWRLVMRVKRALTDPGEHGGYGNDQCYFEGAVEILRNVNRIDFHVLFSGKVCIDEVNRVRRMARLDCIRLPRFMDNVDNYKQALLHIAAVNKIAYKPAQKSNATLPKYLLNSSHMRISWMNKANVSKQVSASPRVSAKKKRKPRKVAVPPGDKPASCMVLCGAKANMSKPVACQLQIRKSKSYSCENTRDSPSTINSVKVVTDSAVDSSKDTVEKDPLPKYRLLKRYQSPANKLR